MRHPRAKERASVGAGRVFRRRDGAHRGITLFRRRSTGLTLGACAVLASVSVLGAPRAPGSALEQPTPLAVADASAEPLVLPNTIDTPDQATADTLGKKLIRSMSDRSRKNRDGRSVSGRT